MKRKLIMITSVVLMLLFTGCTSQNTKEGSIDNMNYKETEEKTNYVKIDTSKGIMLLELYPDVAPITVENFQKLISEKFYDNLTFHRIIKDFMIQGGDPKGDGTGGSEEKIKGEFENNGIKNDLSHQKGVISMARSNAYDSASSQFFICHGDASYLDGNYAAFGKLIAGEDTLDKLANVSVKGETPVTAPKIKSIRFVEIEKGE